MRLTPTLLIGAAVLALSACGERPQTGDARLKSSDAKASSGTQNGHAAPGWTAGDQTSWANQLKARAQGQNEYARSPAAPKTP